MRLAKVFQTLYPLGLAWAMVAAPATAQTQAERTYDPGRGGQDAVAPSGNQELIGHALSMAIESSGLLLSSKTGTYSRGYGPDMGRESPSNTGTTVRAPRDLYGTRNAIQSDRATGQSGSRTSEEIRREDYRVLGAAGSPGMAGYIVSELEQNALRGFEDSSRLFQDVRRRVGGSNSPIGRYLIAAQNYARSLESISGVKNGSDIGTTGGGSLNGTSDIQSVYLVNHGVKEVLSATKIRMMCRLMGDRAEEVDTLRQHAEHMYRDGTRLIDALASSVDISAYRRAALEGSRQARPAPGDNLLDAATSRRRDRDSNPAPRPQASTETASTTGASTAGNGAAVRSDSGAGAEGPGPNARGGYGIRTANASGTATGRPVTPVASHQGSPVIVLARQARELVQILDELNMNTR